MAAWLARAAMAFNLARGLGATAADHWARVATARTSRPTPTPQDHQWITP